MEGFKTLKHVFGPVPFKKLGMSLGINPVPKNTCNYSCLYCQLGETCHMTNRRSMYFPVEKLLEELDWALQEEWAFEVITIVGEGEATLYLGLGELIAGVKKRTEKPVAVITNGALLYDCRVREELMAADIVLPTMDAWDNTSLKQINRPHGSICFEMIQYGLRHFSEEYTGQLWIKTMLVDGINDDYRDLENYREILEKIRYDRIYINTPEFPISFTWQFPC